MSDLPWLLVYGGYVWPAAMVAAAALTCLLAWAQARQRGRQSVAWARGELARPTAQQGLADNA
ncbi:MAG: hypothetical protein Q8S73_00460, partial [Deltaproteobacteria bacterium]|nr:hypothetical protein [Deltaproteobacteria bacterium]